MCSTAPDLDTQLILLADSERRLALTALGAHEPPLTLRDLVTEVVTREHAVPLPDVPPDAMANAFVRFHHVHIPRLVDAGVIEYDAERTLIEDVTLDGLGSTLAAVTHTDG